MYNNLEDSAVAEHSFSTKLSTEFDEVEISADSSHYYERKIIKPIDIRKH